MPENNETSSLSNNINVEEIGPCKKKVKVEIPGQVIEDTKDRQYADLRKDVVVPGFRKGRAPRRLLEKRFSKEIDEKIKLELLTNASEAALKDKKLDVLREPDIDYEQIELPAEGTLKFDFEVVVKPDFELPAMEGIVVEKQKTELTDEQIERQIHQLRRRWGTWTPRKKDSTIQQQDKVIADVIIEVEGQQNRQQNVEIYIQVNGFVSGIAVKKLDELLLGAKIGDKKKTTVEVPQTYFQKDYRGKTVELEIHIRDIKYLAPAELNQDFLKRFGVSSQDELHENVRQELTSQLEQQSRMQMSDQIRKYLLENTDFDLPDDIVAEQTNSLLQRRYMELTQGGVAKEQIQQQMDQLKSSSEQQAREQIRLFFIMDKVAGKLGIQLSDEQVNGFIAQLAIQQGQRPEKLKEQMIKTGSIAQLKDQLREQKCMSSLLESAEIKHIGSQKKKKTAKKKSKKATRSSEAKKADK